MQNERRIELEDSASGGLSLVIHHEDGGLEQVMLTKEEKAELHAWLAERASGDPPRRVWDHADLEGMTASLHKRVAVVTDAEDPLGTRRGALLRAAGHLSMACADLVMMPLNEKLARSKS